jgi:hypothetical protein
MRALALPGGPMVRLRGAVAHHAQPMRPRGEQRQQWVRPQAPPVSRGLRADDGMPRWRWCSRARRITKPAGERKLASSMVACETVGRPLRLCFRGSPSCPVLKVMRSLRLPSVMSQSDPTRTSRVDARLLPVPRAQQMPLGAIGPSRDYRPQVHNKVLGFSLFQRRVCLVVRRAL